MRAGYQPADPGKGIRAKLFEAFAKGSDVVELDAEIAKSFRTSAAINEALRERLRIAEATARLARRAPRTDAK